METLVLFGMQLAIGAGFGLFYLRHDARLRQFERRLNALARRAERWSVEHDSVTSVTASALPASRRGVAPDIAWRLPSAGSTVPAEEAEPGARGCSSREEWLEGLLHASPAWRSAGGGVRVFGAWPLRRSAQDHRTAAAE